ncbi:hypothetical protein [Kitasatospora sp. NPDC091207]|uniref:hypothetical protein n=1 Tax=Kitasatospora sp. NPDC091207 TaxID=3364083 RepID=UPI003805165D
MTVLHSRNADAADAKAAADAKDATDPEQSRGQAATAETGLRDDLGRYAELGAFTLTAGTHAWYAAVDTVATPEDARAASTALAELRGSDLQQTWEAVTALAVEAKIEVPGSVAVAALFAETLQRVHQTSAILVAAAYDADLDALAAATADRAWRRENGVKLPFLRARGLRKQAAALVVGGRKVRSEELHEALASAKVERRAWAVLAPSGALPVPPADGPSAERTAAAFESIGTGLRDLARLLPEHDLEALPFPELIDLVERLAADEGTLYRLPTIRSLRTTLEEAGLTDLLAELAAARADRRAAEAAYGARQALAGGQRDGLTATEETVSEAVSEETTSEEAVGDAATDEEAVVDEATNEETVVEETAVEPEAERVADADAGTEPEVAADAEAEADELTAEEPAEARPLVVSLPSPSPAADDLVDAAPAGPAQAGATVLEDDQPEVAGPAVEDAPVAEEVAAVAEADAPEAVVEPEPAPVVEEPTAVEPAAESEPVEPVAEVAEVEPEAAEPEAAQVNLAADTDVEIAGPAVEDASEAVEPEAVVEPEPASVVEEPAAAEPVAEAEVEPAEPVVEVESAEAVVDAPVEVVEPEPASVVEEPAAAEPVAESESAEPVAEAEVEIAVSAVEDAPVAEEVAPVAEAEETTSEIVEPEAVVEPEPASVVEEPAVVEPVAEAEVEPAEPVVEVESAEAVVDAPVEVVAPEPVAEAVEVLPAGRPEKPDFTPGRPVTAYSADELLAVVRWLDGDGVGRSDEELLRAAMKELGFARLGPRIKEALGAAVTAARG